MTKKIENKNVGFLKRIVDWQGVKVNIIDIPYITEFRLENSPRKELSWMAGWLRSVRRVGLLLRSSLLARRGQAKVG